MPTTPASAGSRAKQQVYVHVPVSPYPISRMSAPVHSLKENTPLRPSNGQSISNIVALKRKVSERDLVASNAAVPSPKKQKLDASLSAQHTDFSPNNPNGFIYCHQCSQKRDAFSSILCTSISATKLKGVEKRCNVKFCGPCLKRRYGEDAIELKAQGAKNSEKGTYTFKCPKCRDICTCHKCRKAKGLEPLGHTRKTAGGPVSKAGIPNNSIQEPTQARKTKVEVVILMASPASSSAKRAALAPKGAYRKVTETPSTTKAAVPVQKKPKQQLLPQPLPVLNWTAVPTALDRDDAETRFQIREFVLRFAAIMEPTIPKAQLAELDDVGCSDGEEELAPWVSEACARSMILGLLGMLADKDASIEKPVKSAIREIRAAGHNLNKIWPILAQMHDAIVFGADNQDDAAVLSFPDPLPPPSSITARVTRSARESSGSRPSITIAATAQMVPVVAALVEAAFETAAVREELENGVKEAKEATREVKECLKAENERWDAERKELEDAMKGTEKEGEKAKTKTPPEIKDRRKAHKRRMQSLENALKVLSPGFASRFAPLGTDSAGRVFWALSPGVYERKAALDFIASATSGFKDTKKARQRGSILANVEDPSATSDWSCFVAVWGKRFPAAIKPPQGKGKAKAADDVAEEDDEAVEQWWGFYQPGEIRKVANWIRIDAGIDACGDADGTKPLAALVKGLNEYAALLEWRVKEDKYES
ncbi:hypothetical protein D9615_004650 [Tricholomella constricta]|uniref:Zinc-finger domain-containing protein n=1 Tax=Tricholomella constricta TaxID=117010 RepID=A0A8H5HC28_9AGAR|nr:hypothetical protein D9615_004650 [Tricholomella constricta]